MRGMTIEYPDEVVLTLGGEPDEIATEAARELAYAYFRQGRLSSGLAAKLAGMSRVAFLMGLGQRGIPWTEMGDEELRSELESA